ncbi:EVE domain-containing protein [Salinibius halmophilus]|uniref:EVE domain-containing protein n=1 Tax=Salinibius halmophilus TaxID=1853216 RepID=UPI000E664661|nr:EVE domain-containing protein [Salinibius halmophilus]
MANWLVKTEPDAYSLADLKREGTTRWDGIRNYQARNFMRDDMQVGDRVFIYHSSCKVPAVVGIAEVVKAAYPDPAQFDVSSKYFDEKATEDKPRWVCVDIAYRSTLTKPVTLKQIKADEAITELALKKSGRLSVMPVTDADWQQIISLAQ